MSAELACPACGHTNDRSRKDCSACSAPLGRTSSDSFWSGDGSPTLTEVLDYAPGQEFGERYTVVDRLGQGGMGVVYKARDQELNRMVALKMMRADQEENPDTLLRFRRELGLAQQVTHKNVCRLHDIGESDGVRYLSMEYLEANTLGELISKMGGLSVKQTLQIADQVCDGLHAIHSRGIVHRDLKPSNIAIDRDGRVVVLDFGLARGPVDIEVTKPGVLVGSYAYLSPEHIQGGTLSESVDVYALGLILFEMLTGRRPPGDLDQRPLALRGESATCPPPSAFDPDVPPELDQVIARCLAFDPKERPSSVEDVGSVVRACLAVEEERVTPRPRPKPFHRRRILLAIAGVAFVVAAWSPLRHLLFGPAAPPAAVAVIPFEESGTADGEAYLADMTTDLLVASLQVVPGMTVNTPYSIRSLAGATHEEIARALGAERLLTGTVAIDGDRVTWSPRVENVHGEILWQEDYQGSVAELVSSLSDTSEKVLRQGLDLPKNNQLPTIPSLRTDHIDAYRSYLKAARLHTGWHTNADVSTVRQLYREAIEQDPSFAAAHAGQAMVSLGQFLKTRSEGDQAVADYAAARALSFGSDLPEAHLASGVVLAGAEQWDEARAAFDTAFAAMPGNEGARRIIGMLYQKLGREAEAREMYEAAVASRPDFWVGYYWLGRFLFLADELEEAPVHLEKAVELNPSAVGPISLLGFYHLARGSLDQARAMYERSLSLEDSYNARQQLGLVHYYAGDFAQALEQWKAALVRAPDRPSAHSDVGDVLRQLARPSEARVHYDRAIELYNVALGSDGQDGRLLAERAMVLSASERCDEATREMGSVLDRFPGNRNFSYYAAVTFGRCGQLDRTVELAIQSIRSGNVVGIWFDPDLRSAREDARVKEPLALIGSPSR